jgi:hypothetical protein
VAFGGISRTGGPRLILGGRVESRGVEKMDVTLKAGSLAGNVEIHLFKDRESPNSYKEFTLRILYGALGGEMEEKIVTIPAQDPKIQDLLQSINSARIVPFAEPATGIDGKSYELTFKGSRSPIIYSWWLSPPEGWEPLQEIASKLLQLAAPHVPVYLPV